MKLTDVPGMSCGGPQAGTTGLIVPWFRRGSAGWLLLAAAILAWDLAAADEQTLSEAFRRCKERPVSRAAVAAVWAVLTAHLFGVLPPRADPFHAATIVVRDSRLRRVLVLPAGEVMSAP